MKKIYLVGTSGYPNYGDELILKNWVSFIINQYPNAELWLNVPFPTIIQTYFQQGNIKVTNTIWRLINEYCCEDHSDFFNIIQEKICYLGTPHYDLSLLNLRNIDIFHIIGGGYINKIWPHHLGILYSAVILKKQFNIKIYGTGLGLMPAITSSEHYKELIKQFDYFEVRDAESANFLNIQLGYDDAYLNNLNQRSNNPDWQERIPDVLICVQNDTIDKEKFNTVVQIIRERIVEHQRQGLIIGYIEAIPGQDRIAFELLQDLIQPHHFFNAAEVITYGLPIKENQIWYSTRFHHHLEASLFGLKGVAVSLNPGYYDIKHNSLLKNGTGWAIWYGNDVLPYPNINSGFIENIKKITYKKQEIANMIYCEGSYDISNSEEVVFPMNDISY